MLKLKSLAINRRQLFTAEFADRMVILQPCFFAKGTTTSSPKEDPNAATPVKSSVISVLVSYLA